MHRIEPIILSALVALALAAPRPAPALDAPGASCGPGPAAGDLRQVRNSSCYVGAGELARWRRDEELVIVDLREADAYRRVRIPGSIHLTPAQLRERSYLRDRHVLLVDRGHLGAPLERVCRELRGRGWTSVGILEGGLNAWARTMGDLEGDRLARRGINRIPARDFADVSRYEHWVVIDVSRSPTPDLDSLVPGAARVPRRGDEVAFRRELIERIRTETDGLPGAFVAIVDRDGRRYEDVERALHALGVVHVFLLDGGIEAYRRHLEQERRACEAS